MDLETRTKIVATIGPASRAKERLKEMIQAGMCVARMNFSHDTHESHLQVIEAVRAVDEELGTNTSLLADLQGPKLRVGDVEGEGVEVVRGNTIKITTNETIGTAEKLYTNYQNFPKDVQAGEAVLLDDGKIELKVVETNEDDEVTLEVIQGGIIKSKKGINLPNTKVSLPCLTEKDLVDLDFALEHDVDWIGLSFVRSARDVIELKNIIASRGKHAKVIAKIEKPEALE
ncbi:MAG: pyruvate kinase, partial [Flavobacteriales bacterium]|nr:pyruvate kinase [Flavobacteriales bacterium]